MFDFSKVPLPEYSRKEDIINSVSHALGVPVCIAALIMCFIKIGADITPLQIFTLLLCGLCCVILYAGSAFYHGLKPSYLKRIARVLDHSNIFLMITGCMSVFFLMCYINYNRTLAIIMFAVSWVLTLLGIFLTFMNQEKFKKVQMIMYIFLGWLILIGAKTVWQASEEGKKFMIFVAVGGVLYLIGAVLYGVGKKRPYVHFVFHLFVLGGTVCQFAGMYLYLI